MKMKRIFKIFSLFMLVLPFIIKASTVDINYEAAIKTANNYLEFSIDPNVNFGDYNKYIVFPNSSYYYFHSSNIPTSTIEKFTQGGLLSAQEYNIVSDNGKKLNYLAYGLEYWTLTPSIYPNMYAIDVGLFEKNSISGKSGVRVTEFVSPRIKVDGKGTKNEPWYFTEMNEVYIKTSNPSRGEISKKINGDCSSTVENVRTGMYSDEELSITFCPKTGYEFHSLTCEEKTFASIGENKTTVKGIDSNVECIANFKLKVSKITLALHGGSAPSLPEDLYTANGLKWFKDNDSVLTETTITTLGSVPTKTGYNFTGFYTASSAGTQIINSAGVISTKKNDLFKNDYTIHAQYSNKTYTVTFDRDGGSGGSDSDTVTYGIKKTGKISVPSKAGYNFDGYWTSKNGSGNKYYNSDGSSTKEWDIDSNTKLYAKWSTKTIRFNFDKKGGSNGDSYKDVGYGENMKDVTPPTQAGYDFDGYFDGEGTSAKQYYDSYGKGIGVCDKTSTTQLYARWKPKKYTIYLDNQGGSGKSNIDVQYKQPIGSITPPTKSRYRFLGYFTQPNGGGTQYHNAYGNINKNYTTIGNLQLYANWQLNSITVNFDYRGIGYGETSRQVNYGSTYGTLPSPSATGYVFDGWYYGSERINSYTSIKSEYDHTLTARWTAMKSCTYTENRIVNNGCIPSPRDLCAASPDRLVPWCTKRQMNYGWYCAEFWDGCMVYNGYLVAFKCSSYCNTNTRRVSVRADQPCPSDYIECYP